MNFKKKLIVKKKMQKEIYGGEKNAQSLCIAMNKIYTSPLPSTPEEKIEAIANYKLAIGDKTEIDESEWDTIENRQADVYTYSEYIQFKRAKFDCTNVEYNQQTGRITSMKFEFTGKFE